MACLFMSSSLIAPVPFLADCSTQDLLEIVEGLQAKGVAVRILDSSATR
jgi:hypothetical protein